MKKETLLKLLLNTKNLKDSILLNLQSICELTEKESESFTDICILNDEFFEKDNLEYILDIYYNLSFLDENESKNIVIDIISELINNDYVRTSEDFNNILSTISNILFLSIDELIDCDIENLDYYKIYIIKAYVSLYNNLLCNYPIVIQDYTLYSNKFMLLLYDLKNTKLSNNEDFTSVYLNRIDEFVSIAKDKEILNLDSEKYKYILSVALNIKDVKGLSKYKDRIKKVSEKMDLDEFRWYLEQYTDFVNDNTIDLIFHELNLSINTNEENIKELIRNNNKDEDKILRKILSPKKNNIIKM